MYLPRPGASGTSLATHWPSLSSMLHQASSHHPCQHLRNGQGFLSGISTASEVLAPCSFLRGSPHPSDLASPEQTGVGLNACLPIGPGVLSTGSQGPTDGQEAFHVPFLCVFCACLIHVCVV